MTQPVRASKVKAEKVEWRWPLPDSELAGRVPKGMITVVAGKRDQGKGLFAAHVAAEVSRSGENVLYSAAEDSHSLMTKPRLEAAEADLERITLWRFKLPQMGKELGEIVLNKEINLIVMDPFARHLSSGIGRYSDNVEKVLAPLTELVEHTGASVLIVEHTNKRPPASGDPLDAIGGGSTGLPAAARAAWLFGLDPDDGDRRILAQAKLNIAQDRPALAFELDVEEIEMRTKKGEVFLEEMPYLLVDEELEAFDPMRFFNSKTKPGTKGRPSDKRADAAEWLTTYLAENGKSKLQNIEEDAKQVQMSRRTLQRAAADMGVVKEGKTRNITWDLNDGIKGQMGIAVAAKAEEVADEAVKGKEEIEKAREEGVDLETFLDETLREASNE